MRYYHVDVFSPKPLGGNGLTAVFPDEPLSDGAMLEITREFKQFETIFLYPRLADGAFPARIFTVDEELLFAGHPAIGAGAVLHELFFPDAAETGLTLALGERRVRLHSRKDAGGRRVAMNQGKPSFLQTVDASQRGPVARAVGVREEDIDPAYPLEVVSTGLPYLLAPLRGGLADSGVAEADFEAFLARYGAKFVYLFDTATFECRTWDNIARTEDAATGSAAGPLCAYLIRHGMKKRSEDITLSQGKFVGRPSVIRGRVENGDGGDEVFITGDVAFFASGVIDL